MKMKTILPFLFILTINAFSQEVTIPGSQIKKITSSIVKGQEYELQMLLPGGFDKNKKYPVVYLMDSQWDFPLVSGIYGEQYYDGFIPELIIVGITWGGINPNPDSLRARDYSPTHFAYLPQSGGAANFLSFMKNELFPFMETNYNADPDQRVLMGCSFGGLFTLYGLFSDPNLFCGYVAASPAIGYHFSSIYQFEKEFSTKNLATSKRLYMTVGGVEVGAPGFENFARQLKERGYKNLSIESKILENTGHSGTKAETYSRGLQYIFQRNDLKLTPAQLTQYVGQYALPNGSMIQLKEETGALVLYFGMSGKYPLKADSEKDFYATSEFFNLTFHYSGDVITGFQLNRYNNSQFATKK